jgi:hypothetical protein
MTREWNLDLHVERLFFMVQIRLTGCICCQAVNSGKFLLAGLVRSVGFNCFWAGRPASGGRKAATKDSC